MASLTPKVRRFLDGKHIGKLATIMDDGSPHVTPIWYMREGDKVVINTTTNRVKYRNIERDGRVCFLVDDGYPYVILFGTARIASERDRMKDIEKLAIRYTGRAAGTKAARTRFWKEPRASIEITPRRAVVEL
ncbi:MAG: PPOX class F420-dependent oxidoreductase [Nitrososphaerota archaeon]|nr:PPOX class F420-dependent oxidoreductase [Nitrososphaerota archaeon]